MGSWECPQISQTGRGSGVRGPCVPLLVSSFDHHIRKWGTESEGTLWDQDSVFWVGGQAHPSEPAQR